LKQKLPKSQCRQPKSPRAQYTYIARLLQASCSAMYNVAGCVGFATLKQSTVCNFLCRSHSHQQATARRLHETAACVHMASYNMDTTFSPAWHVTPLDTNDAPLLVCQPLICPDRHVNVVHVPTAPALVAVVVCCGTSAGNLFDEFCAFILLWHLTFSGCLIITTGDSVGVGQQHCLA
jgi:hypothetical protein